MVNENQPQTPNWALLQMQRMTRFFPERVEEAIHRLFELDPALRNDLVLGAVDQEMLTVAQAAEFTGMDVEDLECRLVEFRKAMAHREVRIEKPGEKGVARIAGTGVSVWEVARELARCGSEDRLFAAFPALNRAELSVALEYARQNPEEIQREIERYEQVVQRRLSEYPFAK